MGFLFRGKHSTRDLEIKSKVVSRPILPPLRVVTETVPKRDGMIDYSTDERGSMLRRIYDDKVLEIEIGIVGRDNNDLNRKLSRVANWLTWKAPSDPMEDGYEPLIFDDMKYIKWMVIPVNLESSFNELQRVYKTTLQFRCQPYNKLTYGSDGIPIGSDVPLSSDIILGFGDTTEIIVDSSFTEDKFVNIMNYGSAPVYPNIYFYGDFTDIWMQTYAGYFKYTKPVQHLRIDCKNQTCKSGITNVTANSSGYFPELNPGMNDIIMVINGTGTIRFWYTPQFYYGEDLF